MARAPFVSDAAFMGGKQEVSVGDPAEGAEVAGGQIGDRPLYAAERHEFIAVGDVDDSRVRRDGADPTRTDRPFGAGDTGMGRKPACRSSLLSQ